MRRQAMPRAANEKRPSDVAEGVVIHAVPEEGGLWIHTHGLRDRALPELELRAVPTWMMRPGTRLLNAIADYLIRPEKAVFAGDVFDVPGFGMVQLTEAEPREPIADHYDHERWTVVNAPEESHPCECCRAARDARQ